MGNYVVQKIQGGLGNQMFQYAFVKGLSLRNHIDFKLDITSYEKYFRPYELEIFDIEKKYVDEKELPFYSNWKDGPLKGMLIRLNPNHVWDGARYFKPLRFEKNFLKIRKGFISGAFLSEKYFVDQWGNIKNDFKFIKPISNKTKQLYDYVKNFNTCSIHVRRGDYLKEPGTYPILDKLYYDKAIRIIREKVDKPIFLIFSDDLNYVSKLFKDLEHKIIVDYNTGKDSWQDMYLMSKCKHNITAHSTFSWWGAYLNDNEEKIVITPKEWFVKSTRFCENDIIPDSWLTI